jgi:hypothetical protein
LNAKLEQQKKNYDELHRLNSRQAQELGQRRQWQQAMEQQATANYTNPQQPDASGQTYDPWQQNVQAQLQQAEQRAANAEASAQVTRFQMDNFDDWRKYGKRVEEMVNDPVLAQRVVSYADKATGQIDYYASYRNALLQAQVEDLRKSQKEAEAAKGQIDQNKLNSVAQATISGQSSVPEGGSVDLDDLRKDPQRFAKFLEEQGMVDPQDPIRPERFLRRR